MHLTQKELVALVSKIEDGAVLAVLVEIAVIANGTKSAFRRRNLERFVKRLSGEEYFLELIAKASAYTKEERKRAILEKNEEIKGLDPKDLLAGLFVIFIRGSGLVNGDEVSLRSLGSHDREILLRLLRAVFKDDQLLKAIYPDAQEPLKPL